MRENDIYDQWQGDRTLLLSKRERAVAQMTAKGLSLEAIARTIDPPSHKAEVKKVLHGACLKLKCDAENIGEHFTLGEPGARS